MSNQYDTARPYLSSFVIVKNPKGEIALVLRENTGWMDGYYGLPSGKVEHDESFSVCAVREAKEEIGVDVKPDDLTFALAMHRYEEGEENWIDVFFVADDWSGTPHNAEPHKHGDILWASFDNLPENMVPNVRDALEQIANGAVYREFNWEKKT